MTENERLLGEIRRAYQGGAFHGPAVFEILDGVDAAAAAAKPVEGAHSIWELVLHVATWNRIPARRVREKAPADPTDAENFPAIPEPSEDAWIAAKKELAASADEIAAEIASLPAERFAEIVPGRSYTVLTMLDGVVQHALYHAGQMALVKKAGAKTVGSIG
jgi:uncharacterized damage-inducible protein DinB